MLVVDELWGLWTTPTFQSFTRFRFQPSVLALKTVIMNLSPDSADCDDLQIILVTLSPDCGWMEASATEL